MSTEPFPARSTELAVDAQGVSRRFWGTLALDNVSLQVPIGSIYGLVGLNGAGKTTLIRHLVGAHHAQTGSVRVLGGDPVSEPEVVLKKVGYLTEEDSLPKWMRVGELLDFTAAVYPSWDDRYARQLTESFSLSRRSRIGALSKGQRARIGLLAAIAHRPQLLVLDEPSSGLDPIARGDILEAIIRTISQDGRTVIFSSHLLDEVDRVCDCVALMHEGRIIETLTTEQLQTRYCEIIGTSREHQGQYPNIVSAFGWRRTEGEWSAVVAAEVANEPDFKERFGIAERRELSLQRWFTARVGTADLQPMPTALQETADA